MNIKKYKIIGVYLNSKNLSVYTELFFEVSVYIKRYEKKVKGKEKTNKKVSTSTLFSLFILGILYHFGMDLPW